MKFLAAVMTVVFLFTGCSDLNSSGQEVWTAFIYPDKANTKRSMEHGQFPTLEACQEGAKLKLGEINASETGFSECGLKCSFHEGMKATVCERVVTNK